MTTPELCLRTRYLFDEDGRIVSTRPRGSSQGRGPAFILVRGKSACASAIHRDVEPEIAGEVESLARDEPPVFAAEAGLETAPAFRGRGRGPRVAAAWAMGMRASGRIPLYSTTWTNDGSLAVARKLGLIPYAATWALSGRSRKEAHP